MHRNKKVFVFKAETFDQNRITQWKNINFFILAFNVKILCRSFWLLLECVFLSSLLLETLDFVSHASYLLLADIRCVLDVFACFSNGHIMNKQLMARCLLFGFHRDGGWGGICAETFLLEMCCLWLSYKVLKFLYYCTFCSAPNTTEGSVSFVQCSVEYNAVQCMKI